MKIANGPVEKLGESCYGNCKHVNNPLYWLLFSVTTIHPEIGMMEYPDKRQVWTLIMFFIAYSILILLMKLHLQIRAIYPVWLINTLTYKLKSINLCRKNLHHDIWTSNKTILDSFWFGVKDTSSLFTNFKMLN